MRKKDETAEHCKGKDIKMELPCCKLPCSCHSPEDINLLVTVPALLLFSYFIGGFLHLPLGPHHLLAFPWYVIQLHQRLSCFT